MTQRRMPVGGLFLIGSLLLMLTWVAVDKSQGRALEPIEPVEQPSEEPSEESTPSSLGLLFGIGLVVASTMGGSFLLWMAYHRQGLISEEDGFPE
ncbi:MAG: hypothetical protein KTR31_30370 [Myxococcales bacterium]|nr:hypothetical protein [Myxococcales bacterium]